MKESTRTTFNFLLFVTSLFCGSLGANVFLYSGMFEYVDIVTKCHPAFNGIDCYSDGDHCICKNRCNDLPLIHVPCSTPHDEVKYFIDHHFNDTDTWVIHYEPECNTEKNRCVTFVRMANVIHTSSYISTMIFGIVYTMIVMSAVILLCIVVCTDFYQDSPTGISSQHTHGEYSILPDDHVCKLKESA